MPFQVKGLFAVMARDYATLAETGWLEDVADAMKLPRRETEAIVGISMRGSLVRGNRLFADQRAEEVRARVTGATYRYLGCRSHELQACMEVLTSHFGTRAGIYLNAFMAGCSEDETFLATVLEPLCAKLGVAAPLAVSCVRAMQGDLGAMGALGATVLGAPPGKTPPPLDAEDAKVAIDAFRRSVDESGDDPAGGALRVEAAQAVHVALDAAALKVRAAASNDEVEAALVLLIFADLALVALSLAGLLNGDRLGVRATSTVVTLLFVLELAARFAAHRWLERDAAAPSFFEPAIVKVDVSVTFVDFGAWILMVAGVFQQGQSLRFVKMLRLARLFRVARAIARDKTPDPVDVDSSPGHLAARLKIQNFRALCLLKSEGIVWDSWLPERTILRDTLFDDVRLSRRDGDLDFVRVVAAAGRSNVALFHRIMTQTCGAAGDDLRVSRAVVDVWNRAMTAFAVDRTTSQVPVDALDARFACGVPGGFSIFVGSVCRARPEPANERAPVRGGGDVAAPPPEGPSLPSVVVPRVP